MPANRTTIQAFATVRIAVDVTVELTDEQVAAIKKNADDYGPLVILDAKVSPNAGVTVSDVREALDDDEENSLRTAVINAVRNGTFG